MLPARDICNCHAFPLNQWVSAKRPFKCKKCRQDYTINLLVIGTADPGAVMSPHRRDSSGKVATEREKKGTELARLCDPTQK
jgi:hypothetical protein